MYVSFALLLLTYIRLKSISNSVKNYSEETYICYCNWVKLMAHDMAFKSQKSRNSEITPYGERQKSNYWRNRDYTI